MNGATDGNGGFANDAGGLEAAVATPDTTGADGGGVQRLAAVATPDTTGADGGGGQRLFIDAAAGGGDGGEDAADAIAGAAGPELLRKLVFEGMTVTSFCIGAAVRPPAHLASHQLLPVAYYLALLVLFLFGVGLLGLAVWVSGDHVGRAAVAKTVMWIAVAPLLLVLSLGGIGMT
ncbi:unnamed protein product [Musa hybrid cultivar]